jgi:hypothetical protein
MSDIIEYYFRRFKIMIISFYAMFFLPFILSLFEGSTKDILTTICVICFLTVIGFFFYYLWICTELVGKSILLYVGVTIFLNIFGPAVIYVVLLKARIALYHDIKKY